MIRRWRSGLLQGAAAVVLFVALALIRFGDHAALLPNPLELELEFAPAEIPRSDPVIVAGETGQGDFLTVRLLDAHTARFAYDSWGHPALVSAPVTLAPGQRLRLRVEMPALDQGLPGLIPRSDRVRVFAQGSLVLDTPVHYYLRDPAKIHFGENPLGGTACGTTFRGRILGGDGRELRGSPALQPTELRPAGARLGWVATWIGRQPGPAALLFALALGAVVLVGRAAPFLAPGPAVRLLQTHRWFLASALPVTLGFAWLVTFGTFRFDAREIFGVFYDYQAASLLEGRLDVPEEAIRDEAFIINGRFYGYFGPAPALYRLPFTLTHVAFGKLSRAYLVGYFFASLLAAYLLLRDATRWARRTAVPGDTAGPSAFSICLLMLAAGWGSTLFFLGSRALIFHEAILAGIALALWSIWCALRFLQSPGSRWWIGALICGLLSIHTRPTTGLHALTVLGCVAALLAWRGWRGHGPAAATRWRLGAAARPLAIGAACVAGALSLNGLAYLKFGVFEAAPLRFSQPYLGTDRLERVEHKSFHLTNLPYNTYAYLLRPNLRLSANFPWIRHGPPLGYEWFPRARIDLPDHTVALPYSMPGLVFLAVAGGLAALVVAPDLRAALLVLWVGVLPMTLALLAAIATAQRYTGDFCPHLIAAAAGGLVGCDLLAPARRRLFRAAAVTCTGAALAVTFALTLHYQGATLWGVPEEARQKYHQLCQIVDRAFGVPPAPPPVH
jgi:hypothetical protein